MIPKVIHYCWFGKAPLPNDVILCIESWKKYCPDFEIIEWNETNFDFSKCRYAVEAYNSHKWAFVSDYARFKIIYEFGGVYLDTDVELIKPISDILSKGAFLAQERSPSIAVAPGLGFAAPPHNEFIKNMINKYEHISFILPDNNLNLKTIVEYTTEELTNHGLKKSNSIQTICGINIYPPDYFCPMDYITGKLCVTSNTHSIHHYSSSWFSDFEADSYRLNKKLRKVFSPKISGHTAAFVTRIKYYGFFKTLNISLKRICQRLSNNR